jgi:acyl-CoA synthetase (AMP-forming)/AMP-acid ligase II
MCLYIELYPLTLVFSLTVCGYTPQCFALRLHPPLVKALMNDSHAKALIISPAYMHILRPNNLNCNNNADVGGVFGSIPVLTGLQDYDFENNIFLGARVNVDSEIGLGDDLTSSEPDLKFPDGENMPPDGVAVILHTSGTTSEKSKIVPITYQWQENVINDTVRSILLNSLLFTCFSLLRHLFFVIFSKHVPRADPHSNVL